jgi:23S rRNA (cytidine1920-2'-O)/16S rRNA (cytidine1409-2'-O)-methyltransferase
VFTETQVNEFAVRIGRDSVVPRKQQKRQRLDELLVTRGLAPDVKEAAAMVMAGEVRLPDSSGSPTPGMRVLDDIEIQVAEKPRFVSRGGEKLEHALTKFQVDVNGMVCLDVGASTGGFTDCLLQRGASKVFAVDTGRGQLHNDLLRDDRVVSMERTNPASIESFPELIQFAVMDVSFTSLEKVLPDVLRHLELGRQIVALLKPQFQARKPEVPKGGVIDSSELWATVIGRFVNWCGDNSVRLRNFTSSPIFGDSGNREFLLLLEK